jgi:hypothetical protein
MKAVAVCLLMCGFPAAALASAPDRVQFTGSVQRDDLTPVTFDLQLPSEQAATLRLSDGSTLELAAPGSSTGLDGASIRLLSPTGRVSHTATVSDAGMTSKSFVYRVCEDQVTYMSPAPSVVPACGV